MIGLQELFLDAVLRIEVSETHNFVEQFAPYWEILVGEAHQEDPHGAQEEEPRFSNDCTVHGLGGSQKVPWVEAASVYSETSLPLALECIENTFHSSSGLGDEHNHARGLAFLRSYTRSFALKMVEVGHAMMSDWTPAPALPDTEAEKQFADAWKAHTDCSEDAWEDARLRSVARYLLGAKGLRVPQRWEWIIPKQL